MTSAVKWQKPKDVSQIEVLYQAKQYQHGRPYATWKKAFDHLIMKYSQDKDEIFLQPNGNRITVNTLSER